MRNSLPLPLSQAFTDIETYVEALLSFITTSELFMTLCGGVHVLDFLTSTQDPYTSLLPPDWRTWFDTRDIDQIVAFLVSADLHDAENDLGAPPSLLAYVQDIRNLCLNRLYHPRSRESDRVGQKVKMQRPKPARSERWIDKQDAPFQLPRSVTMGMNPKKKHEVSHFSYFIDHLANDLSRRTSTETSHLVDFGAGQNYLGRVLASEPYCRDIIALERKHANIKVASELDIQARLVDRKMVRRNKKQHRKLQDNEPFGIPEQIQGLTEEQNVGLSGSEYVSQDGLPPGELSDSKFLRKGEIKYVETEISKASLVDLGSYISHPQPGLMVMSLHSCGNLVHHGLRSIVANPTVRCVALVGCCYNLLTERLTSNAPSYKIKGLRSRNKRVEKCAVANDEDGFPMSARMIDYVHKGQNDSIERGITFNITARMMACQAPSNWTSQDCASFFTRHFYRALLQRLLLNKGAVPHPDETHTDEEAAERVVIIGSLRLSCYVSFVAYVRGALEKMASAKGRGPVVAEMVKDITDEEIKAYETRYECRKKHLSIMWSLMAFSAGVVESTIVVDRYLWLVEQRNVVNDAWVEAVFEYSKSPRNLVVVGIKG